MAIKWHISTTRAFRIAVTLCRAWDRLSLQPAAQGKKNQNRGECLRFELFFTARELGTVEAEPLTNTFFYYVNFRQQKMREKIVYYYLHPRIYFPKLLAVFDKKTCFTFFHWSFQFFAGCIISADNGNHFLSREDIKHILHANQISSSTRNRFIVG